jgi:hypothetical protein
MWSAIKRFFSRFFRDLGNWEEDFEKDLGMDVSPPPSQTLPDASPPSPAPLGTSPVKPDTGTKPTKQP